MTLREMGLYAGLALAVLVACGGDDDDVISPSPEPEPEPQPAADAREQPAPPPVEEVNCNSTTADMEVVIDQLAFMPAETSIQEGDVVHWMNQDSVDHTVTSGRDGQGGEGEAFDSGVLAPGDMYCLQFNGSGSFPYHCEFHPTTMNNGMVSVSAGVTGP